MSQDYNPITTPAKTANGFTSALKIGVPIAVLLAIVFGLTYVMMYAPTEPQNDETKTSSAEVGPVTGEQALRFFNSHNTTAKRFWNPPDMSEAWRDNPLLAPPSPGFAPPGSTGFDEDPSRLFRFSLQDRLYQGIYESSHEVKRHTQFWFENRNPKGVTVGLADINCGACSGGRVAAIPQDVTRNLMQYTALSTLPIGPFNGLSLGLVQPAAQLSDTAKQLQWESHSFENFKQEPVTFKVPAAPSTPDKWAPTQWGILELEYKTFADRMNDPLTAIFRMQAEGENGYSDQKFLLYYQIAGRACEVYPPNLDFGTIESGATDREQDFLVVSQTRGPGSEFGDLEQPMYRVESSEGDSTAFVEIADKKTVRIPDRHLIEVQSRLQQRVRTAYKLTVVVHPKVGDKLIDIGKIERIISITAGGVTHPVKVTAMVRGSVWLDGDRAEIDLGTFPGSKGVSKKAFVVITEKPGVELALIKTPNSPEQSDKKKLHVECELEKQPDANGQGRYKLIVTVPPGKSFGKEQNEILLEVKGPSPQRMRIPISGTGTFGG